MPFGQRLKLRLFLEGVEVPVIAATVQAGPNAPAQCSIQMPPAAEGTRLLPRTLVHLFFLDPYEADSPFVDPSLPPPGSDDPDAQPGPEFQEFVNMVQKDNASAPYKLLFGGEVVGFQWTKNQNSRSLVLQCADWSNYWDYAYQWNNTDLFGPGVKALFSGGSTNLFTDFLEDEGSAILRILQTPSVQFPGLKGLLGGIVHLLEAIGGSYYTGGDPTKPARPGQKKVFAGQNIFFSVAELRLHITQMITAYEADPTTSRLLGGSYDSLFGRTLGGLGSQVSIRQAINALMGIMFHETYAQPCPCYLPGSGNNPSGSTRIPARKDPQYAFVATTADQLRHGLTAIGYALGNLAVATAEVGATLASTLVRLREMATLCKDTARRIQAKEILAAKGFYVSASRALDDACARLLRYQPSKSDKSLAGVRASLDKAAEELHRASDFDVLVRRKGVIASRLNTQVFRPDVWFSAPPCCNVLFPEHVTSFTYQRAFLQEPTRLLLKTNDEFFGEDELFDQFYFAPKGRTLKKDRRNLQAILSNELLDHELFTGILPVFEKMGELNIFGARSGKVSGKMPKIGLAQRSCNFLYFKYRFAARQMQITGKFNPYVAVGFPGLVLDKYADQESLERQAYLAKTYGYTPADLGKQLGTHFLANFTEVSHTVDQNQGTTQYNCSYARQVDESIEFLGVIAEDQTVQRRADKDAARTTVVAALQEPRVGAIGPSRGVIAAVEDVSEAYRTTDQRGQSLPVYPNPPNTTATVRVVTGVLAPASTFGPAVRGLAADPAELLLFHAYRVTEDVPRYRKETVDLPAEEYIRPGWYGDCWHPSVIGKVYQQFFRVGAITDSQQVTLGQTQTIGTTYEAAEAALAKAREATSQDDPALDGPGLLALDTGSSIQAATAFLVQTYSYLKQQALNVDDFIKTYTWRPIASLVDLFGTYDLVFDAEGHNVLAGTEGFHSRAFGPYNDLFGLVTPDIEAVTGIKRGSTTAQKADVRKRKQDAVKEYVAALQVTRAILG